jgi:hypothetical protein
MWISNVPSSVLCVSIALPIVHQLPHGDPFAKALLLGIAFSNNIGGMTTPIASPQNVIAFGWCEQASQTTSSLLPLALVEYDGRERHAWFHAHRFSKKFLGAVLSLCFCGFLGHTSLWPYFALTCKITGGRGRDLHCLDVLFTSILHSLASGYMEYSKISLPST